MGKSIPRIRWVGFFTILIVVHCSFFIACHKNSNRKIPHRVINGVLDLSNWDLEKDGPIELSGEWEFYWGKHLTPKDFSESNPSPKTGLKTVPGSWNGYLFEGKPLSGDGYATYRLIILMNDQKGSFAVSIKKISTAFTAYVNGEQISFAGIAGKDIETTVPRYLSEVSNFISEANQLEIILQVSNFHHREGGPRDAIWLGSQKEIQKIRERALVFDMFLCGSILLIGFYHLSMFVLRRKDRSPLYFGTFCFMIALRLLSTGERYITNLFPGLDWEIVIKIEYLAFYLALPLFATFMLSIFPREFSKRVLRIIQFTGIVFAGIVILTQARINSHTVPPFQAFTLLCCIYGVYGLTLSLIRKRAGAFLFLLGFVIIFLTVVNDILYSRMITDIGYLTPLGLLAFIVFQAFILSHAFQWPFRPLKNKVMN